MGTVELILKRFKLDGTARPPINLDISRWRGFPELLRDLGYKRGAEIGVEQGVYSERLCQMIPDLELHCVDAWEVYPNYREHVSQAELDQFYVDTGERLKPYKATLVRKFSVEAAKDYTDGYFDFVYIDGNHDFLHVTEDIAAWGPKVRAGGILAGHDFRRSRQDAFECNVKDVVQAWAYSHRISPWFVITHDKSPSWMWVC